jgi:CRISPR/Cas system-associated exonuclease Cas4 (RecB family)
MPTKVVTIQQMPAWSYSRLSTYTDCPRKAKYKFLDKLEEPGSSALERGSAIHKLAEEYANGRLKTLPAELKAFKAEFEYVKKVLPVTEQQWAFDKDWVESDWFAKNTWARMVVDLYYTEPKDDSKLVIIDHKTGKINPAHKEQLGLYALGGMCKDEKIQKVEVKLWYLDHGEEVAEMFVRSADFTGLKAHWNKAVKPMMSDKKFAPRPGNACKWCHFKKNNGGPCEY